jgi:hypothetical protein
LRLEEAFDMRSHLLLGTAAVALALAAGPVHAQVTGTQVTGTEIEGPISGITHQAPTTDENGQSVKGTVTVMGIEVRVRANALVHTPTATTTLEALATDKMPGRDEKGFVGGTAIITGESINGKFYGDDVFSDLFEHVVVGEATGVQRDSSGVRAMTINDMKIVRSSDPRMPAAPPINGFGLRIRPNSITPGTLVAAEGYYSKSQDILYYHALEADSAELVNTTSTQVSILRADCRIRGGGRDEIEVRGGVANPGNAFVQIRIPSPTPANPDRFLSIGTVQAVADTPPQGLYRADFRNLNLIDPITGANVCPSRVRAVILATSPGAVNQATATADMEGR